MKSIVGLSLVSLALGARFNVQKRASPLEVKIESVGNSAVKASLVNTGTTDLKVLKTGSILDEKAVEKAEIFAGSMSSHVSIEFIHIMTNTLSSDNVIDFDGLRLTVTQTNLPEDAFQILAAGSSTELEWDPAEVHDLSSGGDFHYVVRGSLQTAPLNSTELDGVISYDSNLLYNHVDGKAASKVRRDFHERLQAKIKRTSLQSDCTGTNGNAQRAALQNCRTLANDAANAASNGSAQKLTEYFKSSTSSTRSTVAGVFQKIASECGSTSGGVSTQYCTDVLDSCESGVLAYTAPTQSLMVSCPLYFNQLDALTSTCHMQDQASTTLHEVTHLRQVKGTQDYGYGYSSVQQLSSTQNLNNADTYTLFANGKSIHEITQPFSLVPIADC